MQLDHINLCAPADLLETVRAFYCDVLGFKVGPRPEIPAPGFWLYAAGSSSAAVHLLESDRHQRVEASHLDHIAFKVADLNPIRAALEDRDIPYSYLQFPDFKIEQIQFLDPTGTRIELNGSTT